MYICTIKINHQKFNNMSKNNALLNRGTSRKPLFFYFDSHNFSLPVQEKGHYGVILGSRKVKEFSTRSGLLKYLSVWFGYLRTACPIGSFISLVDLDTNEVLCYPGVPNGYLDYQGSDMDALFSDTADFESGSTAASSVLCDF